MRRLILILAITNAACLGQILGDASAVNAGNLAGSYQTNYGVAPGSRFAILGSGLGSEASQESFPLATQLGEASVKVTVGNFTADCWLLSTRADRVIALLPSSTPTGDGTVTLTRGPLRATTKIHVIPVALGLLARNQSELGPAFAYHDNTNPITLLDSAVSGENVTIRGTGLGAVSADEGAGPAPTDLSVPLDVRVGGAVATVVSARRSDTLAGVDEIIVQVPPGVQGCSVPVAIRAAGAVSNYVTLPVHDGGGACSDSYGFTSDALANLPSGRDARIGVIPLTRVGLSNAGVTALTDSGHMYFASYSPDQLISRRGLTVATTPGACVVASITSQSGDTSTDPVAGSGLSVGQVTISGPKGTKTIDPSQAGKLGEAILLPIPGLPPGVPLPTQGDLFLEPGSYTIMGTASREVGAFSVSFQLPAAVEWSNQPSPLDALNLVIPRDQDFLVQWKNGNDPDLVIITGFGLATDSGAEFICTERASKGSFSVPAFVLSSIPATLGKSAATLAGIGGGLSVGSISGNPGRFSADQLDLGYVTFSTSSFIGIGGWR
jgi:uncharacterized protein (TIGR03437 family)